MKKYKSQFEVKAKYNDNIIVNKKHNTNMVYSQSLLSVCSLMRPLMGLNYQFILLMKQSHF